MRLLHLRGRMVVVGGATACAVLLAGCPLGGERCEQAAAEAYQDHLITYDVAQDVTEVEATVRIADFGSTIRMTGGCRLRFDDEDLAAANRGKGTTIYVATFDGFHGEGVVSFTDVNGLTVDNSLDVDPADFTLTVPTTTPETGFELTIGAPPMDDAYVAVRVEDGASHSTVVHDWVGEPIELDSGDWSPAAAGDEVILHVAFGFDERIGDPPGAGEIGYRQRFEPVRITLSP